MTVTVLLFGHYRDFLPSDSDNRIVQELSIGATVADCAAALGVRDSRFSDILLRTRVAVRAEFAAPDAALTDGDEVAFLPPMSGG